MAYTGRCSHEQYSPEGERLPHSCHYYAYALMSNLFHLLLYAKDDTVGNIVKRIASSYVYYFNTKYGRKATSSRRNSAQNLVRTGHTSSPCFATSIRTPSKLEWPTKSVTMNIHLEMNTSARMSSFPCAMSQPYSEESA